MDYFKMAQGVVTSTGGATAVILPYTPTRIRISNATRAIAASGVTRAWWDVEMGSGAAMLVTTGVGPADGTSYITAATGGGFSTFQAALSNQFGPVLNVSTITKAASAVVTTSAPHGLITGDIVIFSNLYQTSSTGMQQLSNIPFVITKTGASTFTIAFDTSGANFTAYNSGTSTVQGTVKKVLYPFLYAPGVSDISAISLGATTVVTTCAPHNFVVGQEVAFRIPAAWGTTQLNSLPNVVIPGSPVYGFVTVVNSSTQVTVNINSTGYTAFTAPTVAQVLAGLAPAQILAVGDNNSGSNQFGFNSPVVNGVSTINGPAIAGAFINNTNQGFIIGASVAGSASDVIYWEADYAAIV